jgi:hypothetical protein
VTTIVYRDGIIAADSRATYSSEDGGARVWGCEKLFRRRDAIIATAGETGPGLVFVDWYASGAKTPPSAFIDGDADFSCLVLTRKGLFEFDKWCRGERITSEFYAIGSGAKAAMGALHMGASARRAVAVACKVDPFTAAPVVWMSLK